MPRNGSKAQWSNCLWNEKGKGQYTIRREQHKPEKSSVSQGEGKTKKKKTITTEEWKGNRKAYDEKGMYFRGRGNCRSWSWLNTLWHISNGYKNEWTSKNHCNGNE